MGKANRLRLALEALAAVLNQVLAWWNGGRRETSANVETKEQEELPERKPGER